MWQILWRNVVAQYRKELTDWRFIPDVFKENVERLKKLDANVTPALLVHYFQEEGEHVPFQEKTGIKIESVIFLLK